MQVAAKNDPENFRTRALRGVRRIGDPADPAFQAPGDRPRPPAPEKALTREPGSQELVKLGNPRARYVCGLIDVRSCSSPAAEVALDHRSRCLVFDAGYCFRMSVTVGILELQPAPAGWPASLARRMLLLQRGREQMVRLAGHDTLGAILLIPAIVGEHLAEALDGCIGQALLLHTVKSSGRGAAGGSPDGRRGRRIGSSRRRRAASRRSL